MSPVDWIILITAILVVGSLMAWVVYVLVPRRAVRDFDPDDGTRVELRGTVVMRRDFRCGLFKEEKLALYFLIRHAYLLVEDPVTGMRAAVLVNLMKKQFKHSVDELGVGDRVTIEGAFMKRAFDNEAAIEVLEASNVTGDEIPEKKTSKVLQFFGGTTTYNPLLHPFGIGIRNDSPELQPVVGTVLVADTLTEV
ncbi:MAG: hypothetical protein KKF41_07910 [Actinobacteria bacterium]|nr:hypothetical protein [Actinomycetota bacterium]MBU1944176.1 hypothetical protein [Actinomycetota bacterium]MBU2687495.1 hypothetical protein [Actinomycetota bacterium]